MSQPSNHQPPLEPQKVTVEEVNRVLEVGKILFAVLTDDEKDELIRVLNGQTDQNGIGNTGVT